MDMEKHEEKHEEPEWLCNYQQKFQKYSFTLQNIPKYQLQEWLFSSTVQQQSKVTETKENHSNV